MIAARRTALVLLLAALGGGAWILWGRPSALEEARRALDRGDAAAAVEVVLKRLEKETLPDEEVRDLRRELARAYLLKGAYDSAEETVRRLIDKDPGDAYAHLTMGFLFFSRGQDAFAVDHFQKAKALSPQDLRASRALTALFNFRGDHDKARAEALDLLNRLPTDAGARLGLGLAELGRGLFVDASDAFGAVLAAAPADAGARRLLVAALLGAGELLRAEEALVPLLEKSPDDPAGLSLQADFFRRRSHDDQAEALRRRAFEKDPRRLSDGIALAASLARRGETDAAQSLLLDIAPRLPKPEDVPPPPYGTFYEPWDTLDLRRAVRRLRVDFHLAMAAAYRSRYLLPDAERQVRLALQLSPRDADALRAFTDLKRLGGDPQERLAAARAAADLFPEHPEVLLDLSEALLAVKRPQDALTFAQGAAAACPPLARAHAVLAEAQTALDRQDAAAASADKAVSLNDRDPSGFAARGALHARRGQWKDAAAAFGRALELDPFLARAHWERARALEKIQKKRDAVLHRERARELEPRVYAGRA